MTIKNQKELFKELLSNTVKGNKKIVSDQSKTVNEFEKMVNELKKQTEGLPVIS